MRKSFLVYKYRLYNLIYLINYVFLFQARKNYEFGYAVKDAYGDDHSHKESRLDRLIDM